jgi:hypothetical protein
MKFGFRMPSVGKRVSARLSPARFIRHNLGVKMPRGGGILSNPDKFLYNKVYQKTTFGIDSLPTGVSGTGSKTDTSDTPYDHEYQEYCKQSCTLFVLGRLLLPCAIVITVLMALICLSPPLLIIAILLFIAEGVCVSMSES